MVILLPQCCRSMYHTPVPSILLMLFPTISSLHSNPKYFCHAHTIVQELPFKYKKRNITFKCKLLAFYRGKPVSKTLSAMVLKTDLAFRT